MYEVIEKLNLAYTDKRDKNNRYDLYLPDTEEPYPLLVFYFGGGLCAGKKEDLRRMGREFAENGIAVAAPDYRLHPEVDYPVFIEDAAESTAFLYREYGNKVSKFIVGGYSAGGYLTMMLCFNKDYLASYGIDPDDLGGWVFLSGQPTAHFNVLSWQGIDPRRVIVDETAPLYHVHGTGAPILIITSNNDMPNRYEQNMLLAGTLRHMNYQSMVEVRVADGVPHDGFLRLSDSGHSHLYDLAHSFIEEISH